MLSIQNSHLQALVNCHGTGQRNSLILDGDQKFCIIVLVKRVVLFIARNRSDIYYLCKGQHPAKCNLSVIFKMEKKLLKTVKKLLLNFPENRKEYLHRLILLLSIACYKQASFTLLLYQNMCLLFKISLCLLSLRERWLILPWDRAWNNPVVKRLFHPFGKYLIKILNSSI